MPTYQGHQIGLFLKVTVSRFSDKSSITIWQLFGYFEKYYILYKTTVGSFWQHFEKIKTLLNRNFGCKVCRAHAWKSKECCSNQVNCDNNFCDNCKGLPMLSGFIYTYHPLKMLLLLTWLEPQSLDFQMSALPAEHYYYTTTPYKFYTYEASSS